MESWIAVTAALAAVVAAAATGTSGWFIRQQVREMKRQTVLQQEIAESASAPYIWADVRLESTTGWNLEFVVGNSGPTVATDVRVSIDPPLPATDDELPFLDAMTQRLSEGLASLAPGRSLHWTLGESVDLVNRAGSLAHRVRIDCLGPHGRIPTSEYIIDMNDFRVSVAHQTGSLVDIAKSIDKLAKKLPD